MKEDTTDYSKFTSKELCRMLKEEIEKGLTPEELAEEEEAMKYLPNFDDDEDADITVQTVMMKKKRGKSKK